MIIQFIISVLALRPYFSYNGVFISLQQNLCYSQCGFGSCQWALGLVEFKNPLDEKETYISSRRFVVYISLIKLMETIFFCAGCIKTKIYYEFNVARILPIQNLDDVPIITS